MKALLVLTIGLLLIMINSDLEKSVDKDKMIKLDLVESYWLVKNSSWLIMNSPLS